jgi:hypothetical protein
MNEPKRAREVGPEGLRALVEAGRRDAPPAELQDAVLKALGVGTAIAAGSSAHSATWRVVARFSSGIRHAAVSKIGIGFFAMTTAVSAGYFASRESEHAHATASTAPAPSAAAATPLAPSSALSRVDSAPPAPSPAPTPPTVSSPPALATQALSPMRVASPRSPTAAVRGVVGTPVAVTPPAQAAPSTIAVELESIRRVRALLDEGNPKAALTSLDAYEVRNPRETFEEEAMALRARALRAIGDEAGAEREQASLAARFPRSVHLPAPAK